MSGVTFGTHLYEELPNYKVLSLVGTNELVIDGTDSDHKFVSTRSISTYPILPGGERDGDPIADKLFVQLHDNRAIVAIADGCNWGPRPQRAAQGAIAAFSKYLGINQTQIHDLQDAGHYLLRAFSEAHNKIIEGTADVWDAGTTTLLGSLLLEFDNSANPSVPRWGFLCVSVGDCKAFLISPKRGDVRDITNGNRSNIVDGKDPGGRLGPYVGHGGPDLRNLRLYFTPCDEGDLISLVSDGVHDNLDPHCLGKLPKDLGLPQKTWDEIARDQLLEIKASYMKQTFKEVAMTGELNPQEVTNKLIAHCIEVTRKSREWMENNPQKKQPTDYVEFPGKMDHTTAVTICVGMANHN